jgi:two-component system, LytTR family, response regulator
MTAATRRVLVADDEALARERIIQLLARRGGYEVVAESETGTDAVDSILAADPDVVFLDIRMPGLSGIEVAQAVDAEDRAAPVIVFVTAHDEFALAAFDVAAADYLLKPVDRDRFDRALERVEARLAASRGAGLDPAMRSVLETLQSQRAFPRRFLVRAPKGYYFVKADDVEWVDAQGNYVRLHAGGRAHMVRATMKGFANQLDPERFVRVHRSAIVAVDCVERIEPYVHGEYRLTLRDGTRLTSSRAHSEALKALLR